MADEKRLQKVYKKKGRDSLYLSATSGVGLKPEEVEHSIYECMVEAVDPKLLIQPTSISGLDLLPSYINLVGAEVEMVNFKNREGRIRESLKPIVSTYDYIIVRLP